MSTRRTTNSCERAKRRLQVDNDLDDRGRTDTPSKAPMKIATGHQTWR
jgi:hypothetical protein